MTWTKRIANIIIGLLYSLLAILFMRDTENAVSIIVLLISISASLYGLNNIMYFIGMARYMVGGKAILYRGVIALDFGLFSLMFATIPSMYCMIYLLAIKLFYGLVGILRALEAKRLNAEIWKTRLILGCGNILIVIVCLFFMKSKAVFVAVYSIGLINSAIGRIARALKKTAMVYIQ